MLSVFRTTQGENKVTLEILNDGQNIKNIWEMTKKIKSKMIVLYWRLSRAKRHSKHQ
jgi:hypothetical protein